MFAVQHDHLDDQHEIRIAEESQVGLQEQTDDADDPERREKEIRDRRFEDEIEQRPDHDVLAVLARFE